MQTNPKTASVGAQDKLLGIECARGIAASMVVFYHAARHVMADVGFLPMGNIWQFGHAGVDFFFVLSGFIIFFVHGKDLGRPSGIGHYVERRFTRIYPLYWFAVAIVLGLAYLSPRLTMPSLGFVMQSLTLLPHAGDTLVGVAWTLQHEVLFYFLFAIAILNARLGAAVFVFWLMLIFLNGYNATLFSGPLASRALSMFNVEFFFGMLAAYVVRKNKLPMAQWLLVCGAMSFLGFAAAEYWGALDGYGPLARWAYGLSSMVMVLGLGSGAKLGGGRSSFLVVLGSASYSIYLLHVFAIGVIYKLILMLGLPAFLPTWAVFLTLVAGVILTTVLLSRLVEYPLMKLTRRLITNRA